MPSVADSAAAGAVDAVSQFTQPPPCTPTVLPESNVYPTPPCPQIVECPKCVIAGLSVTWKPLCVDICITFVVDSWWMPCPCVPTGTGTWTGTWWTGTCRGMLGKNRSCRSQNWIVWRIVKQSLCSAQKKKNWICFPKKKMKWNLFSAKKKIKWNLFSPQKKTHLLTFFYFFEAFHEHIFCFQNKTSVAETIMLISVGILIAICVTGAISLAVSHKLWCCTTMAYK